MADLVAALGLAVAIEGILFALFPERMKQALADAATAPSDRMRMIGLVSAAVGVLLVWGARRLGW